MEQQDIIKVNLTEKELIEVVNKKRNLLVELCNKMLENERKNKTRINFEDELGVENQGIITRRDDNITIFDFWSTEYDRKIGRQVSVWYRVPIKSTILGDEENIKSFEIKYRDKEESLVGRCKVKYCCDGKTVSYADYEYYDELNNEEKSGHIDKNYERILIQGILQDRIKKHTNDKFDEMPINK